MRLKHRFLVCQVELDGSDADGVDTLSAAAAVTMTDVYMAVRASVQDNFGDSGVSAVGPLLAVKYYNPITRLTIVRCPTAWESQVCGSVRTLRTAMAVWHGTLVARLKSAAAGAAAAGAGGKRGDSSSTPAAEPASLLDDAFWVALDADLSGVR